MSEWVVVLVYLVPMLGTVAQMWRRAGHIWRIGESLRALLPEDRLYRKVREWDTRFVSWKIRHHLASYTNFQRWNLIAGRIEYAVGHLRDYTIGLWMMAAFVFDVTIMIFGDPPLRADRFPRLFYHGFFALLTLWTYRRHVGIGLQMTEFMRANPDVHPQEFFDHYYRRLGPLAIPIPEAAANRVSPAHVSYRTGRPPQRTVWIWIHGAYDTAIFARSAFRALETMGPAYGREVFDVMAALWGSRMLQLFQAELRVRGIEKFGSLSGQIILVFNHKTYLDFVFGFFALSSARRADGRRLRPRFIAAKDHLYDNRLVHSGFGIGKLIESVDMVFVDRKGKGKQAIEEASRKLADKEIEIAMYPQGTRALANYGAAGERLDAGYYTTGTAEALKKEFGHLKKGCAHLAIDTTRLLKGRVPVHLVFIGTNGIATIQPKGSYQIQTEGIIDCQIGDVLTLEWSQVKDLDDEARAHFVDELQGKIDLGLVKALNLHESLRRRFLAELRQRRPLSADQLLKMNRLLTQAEHRKDRTPFKILDRIFALPAEEQPEYLERFSRDFVDDQDLMPLLCQVTDTLCHQRGREMKRVVLEEGRRQVA